MDSFHLSSKFSINSSRNEFMEFTLSVDGVHVGLFKSHEFRKITPASKSVQVFSSQRNCGRSPMFLEYFDSIKMFHIF